RAAAGAVGDRVVVHGDDGGCRCDHVCGLVRGSRRAVEVEYGRLPGITQRVRHLRSIIQDWRGPAGSVVFESISSARWISTILRLPSPSAPGPEATAAKRHPGAPSGRPFVATARFRGHRPTGV